MPTSWVAQQHCLVLCRQAISVQGVPGGAGEQHDHLVLLDVFAISTPFSSWVYLSHGVAALDSQLSSIALTAIFIMKLLSQ